MMPILNIDNNNQVQLHPVTLTHVDGSSETVYIEDAAQKKQKNWMSHVQLTYIVVATLALSLSAYFTYLQLKHAKNG